MLKRRLQKNCRVAKEVMKRRTPADLKLRPARFESLILKKAYTAKQLAEIGAITLKWNQIEGLYRLYRRLYLVRENAHLAASRGR